MLFSQHVRVLLSSPPNPGQTRRKSGQRQYEPFSPTQTTSHMTRSCRTAQSSCTRGLRRFLPPMLPFSRARRARSTRSSLWLTQVDAWNVSRSAPRSPLGTIQSSALAWRQRARRSRQRRCRLTASSIVRGEHQVGTAREVGCMCGERVIVFP